MAKKDYANAFDMFQANEVKVATIKALGDAEIKYRHLTMQEADNFNKRIISDYGVDGQTPTINFDEASAIKYEKASLILVEPKMTVAQLKALPSSAIAAITEINALIEDKDPMVDDEGNSND